MGRAHPRGLCSGIYAPSSVTKSLITLSLGVNVIKPFYSSQTQMNNELECLSLTNYFIKAWSLPKRELLVRDTFSILFGPIISDKEKCFMRLTPVSSPYKRFSLSPILLENELECLFKAIISC